MNLKKFTEYRGKNKCFCSIARSGWVTFASKMVKQYEIPPCKTCDFLFSKPSSEVVLILHLDGEGNRMVRINGNSYGTSVVGFIRRNPSFVGYYELKDIERDEKTVTIRLKRSKKIGGVLNEGYRSKRLDKKV